MPRPEWIEIGRIVRAHGIHGEVRVASSSDNPDRLVPGAYVYARPGRRGLAAAAGQRAHLRITSVRGVPEEPIVAFAGVSDRDEADALRGHILEVPSSELPELEDGEYYPFDLEGLEVRTPAGESVGVVVEVVESPAHDILVVGLSSGGAGGRAEALVPFVEAAVPVVEPAAGYLVVEPRFLEPPDEA
ncbi:MAG: ribosome maturation factor RimM [Actinobacteria bacterium]|nr:ribosome maturation factor RimM [Actinomycetota bacterium]